MLVSELPQSSQYSPWDVDVRTNWGTSMLSEVGADANVDEYEVGRASFYVVSEVL